MEHCWVGRRCPSWWNHKMNTHTHTCTHTHIHPNTPKTSSQVRPSLVPPRRFAQLPLLGPHKPDQAEESGTQPSSSVSRGRSPVKDAGVPVVGEDGNCATFYSILMLLWTVMDQWLLLLRPGLQRSDLQYPAWQGWAFMAFGRSNREDCFRRCLSESGFWALEWVKNHHKKVILQLRNIYLSFLCWDQNGISCPGLNIPHYFILFLMLRRGFIFYFLEVNLSVWFHIVEGFPKRPLESLLFLWDEDHISTNYSSPPLATRWVLSSL